MPLTKKDIVSVLIFVAKNEPISSSKEFPKEISANIAHKLFLSKHILAHDRTVSYMGENILELIEISITTSGIVFLDELTDDIYKKSILGIALPKVEKLLWLIAGMLMTVIIKWLP
jgi:hypothetical protein